ncbi:hypothetical protein Dimus_026535 [Dionaea muscipula]
MRCKQGERGKVRRRSSGQREFGVLDRQGRRTASRRNQREASLPQVEDGEAEKPQDEEDDE